MKGIRKVDLNSFNYMYENSSNREALIEMVCRDNILTYDFVREYYQQITPEMFSKSQRLDFELAKEFPDLFDYRIWEESDSQKSTSFLDCPSITEEMTEKLIRSADATELTPEILNKFSGSKFAIYLLRSKFVNTEFINNNIDTVAKVPGICFNAYYSIPVDIIEKVITEVSKVNPYFILSALSISRDTKWVKKMINILPENERLIKSKKYDSLEGEIISIIDKFDEISEIDNIIKFLEWCNNMREQLCWEPTRWFLSNLILSRDIPEELVLMFIDDIKRPENAGLIKPIVKYAKENSFASVLLALCIS